LSTVRTNIFPCAGFFVLSDTQGKPHASVLFNDAKASARILLQPEALNPSLLFRGILFGGADSSAIKISNRCACPMHSAQ
jgi:hypothetical protein